MTAPAASPVDVTGGSVLRGGLWQVLNAVVPQFAVFALSLVGAHVLGERLFGLQSYIAFVELTVVSLVADGLNQSVLRHVARAVGAQRWSDVHVLVRWGMRRGSAAVAGVGAVMAAFSLTAREHRTAWVLASVAAVVLSAQVVIVAVAHAFHRWRQFATMWVALNLASVAVTIVVLLAGGGVEGVFAVEALYAVSGSVLTARLARSCLDSLPDGSADAAAPADTERLGREAARFAIVATFTTVVSAIVWRRTEFFFLEHYAGTEEIAIYSVPFALTTAVVRLPTAFTSVLGATFANFVGSTSPDRLRDAVDRVLRLSIACSVPLTVGVGVAAPRLVSTLYPAEFARSGPVLRLMILMLPLSVLFAVSTSVLQALGRLRFAAVTAAVAAVVNIVADVVLIPRHGAMGAATATLLGQAAASIPLVVLTLVALRSRCLVPSFAAANLFVGAGSGLLVAAGLVALDGAPGLALGGLLATLGLLAAPRLGWLDARDRAWLRDGVPFGSSAPVRLILGPGEPMRNP